MATEDPAMRVHDSQLEYDGDLIYRRHGELFTGIGYDDTPEQGMSEVSYRDGVQEGPARDWYLSGRLKGESYFRENVQHGVAREYAENGNVLSEAVYEYGILLSRAERNASGEMRSTYELSPDNPNYELVDRFRREKNWPRAG